MPKNVVCKKSNNLVNDWCEKVIKYTCGAGTLEEAETNCTHFIRGECTASFCEYRRKKQTNADRIRAMSDDELAEFLTHINPTNCQDCAFSHGWRCQPDRDDYSDFEKCEEGRKRWLKQSAEEDNKNG